MSGKIVFACAKNAREKGKPFRFLFRKKGIFSLDPASGRHSNYICPLDRINMNHPDLYSFEDCFYPSMKMRCLWLPAVLARFAPLGAAIFSTNMYEDTRDSIIILSKPAVASVDVLKTLKKNGNILLFDFIDFALTGPADFFPYIDGLIASSVKGAQLYRELPWIKIPVFHVAHNLDPSFNAERIGDLDKFSPLYNGNIENLLIYPSMQRLLPVFPYTSEKKKAWIEATLHANFFYAVRPKMHPFCCKPFLKGYTAARLNSNILIHKDDGDALHYLGEDYPYLIKENLNEKVVLKYFITAREGFGGAEWNKGLEKMRAMRSAFSDETIATQFWKMAASFQ